MFNFPQVFLKVSLHQLPMLLVLLCVGQFVDGVQVCVCLLELVLDLVVGLLLDEEFLAVDLPDEGGDRH